jgi:hypothetical protein
MTEGENMVERVARALAGHDIDPSNLIGETYMHLARTAIEALMEPSFDMLEAGQVVVNLDEEVGKYEFLSRDEITEIFQAMLRTALQPNDEETK